ncbi:MAG TPA: type II toxin-antitoxin system RelE/ParE family toxin [Urbifossiella sp.]|jgi:plasmid stabilization system protein ParE
MSLPIILQPALVRKYDEAFDWFESHWPGSGPAFANAIENVFSRLAANPKMYGKFHGEVCKAVVKGYRYYCVFYRERENHVEVLSIFHTNRDPSIWMKRA